MKCFFKNADVLSCEGFSRPLMWKLLKVHSDFVSSSRVEHAGEQWLKPGLRKCKSAFTLTHENMAAHVNVV